MGAEEDFDRFVRSSNARLLRTAWLLVGDWPAAEDLVQIALERLWPKWSRLPDDQQRLAYVHRILTTSFLRGRRRKWTGEIATADLPEPAAQDGTDALAVRDGVLSRDQAPATAPTRGDRAAVSGRPHRAADGRRIALLGRRR